MAKKTGIGTLPHEIMMEKFRKEGRVHREELSLKALTLDHRLQARDKPLDLDHVKELHGYVKDGAVFPPIVVFRVDGKGKNYVGNGFHRCEVHKKEGRPSIKADVVSGTWQEAVEFATCCNFANAALTPTNEDKKKAGFMLLMNGWLERPLTEIAKHVGASTSAAAKWRAEYCESTGTEPPTEIVDSRGRTRPSQQKGGAIVAVSGRNGFRSSIGGKQIHFPAKTKQEAESMHREAVNARESSLAKLRNTTRVATFLARRDIFLNATGREVVGLQGGECRGFALTFISEDLRSIKNSASYIVEAVGRAVLLGERHKLTRKVVLVYEPTNSDDDLIDIARRLGIEFMTMEQFVEAVKADEGDAAKAV